jgi:hypothetical protein
MGWHGMDLECFCEHPNEPSCSIKKQDFLHLLTIYVVS